MENLLFLGVSILKHFTVKPFDLEANMPPPAPPPAAEDLEDGIIIYTCKYTVFVMFTGTTKFKKGRTLLFPSEICSS